MRYIAIDRRGPYLRLTFDRPDKLNVLHAEDLPGLRDIIMNLDPGVTGLVFTGAGQAAFSAGMNIETFVGMDRAGAKAFIGQLAQIMQAIRRSPVVTIAAVSGYCLGGVAEQAVPVHGVHDAPPGAGAGEVPLGFQVGHDGLHGALGQADDRADVPDAGLGVAGDFHQDMPVACEQRPGPAALVRVAHAP